MRRTAFLFVLFVAAIGGVALAGCGQEQEQTATPETVVGETTTETTETETETTETDETETETTETDETETETETTVTTPVIEGDPAAGKEVFLGSAACGGCHTLADAGIERAGRPEPRRVAARLRARPRPRDERAGRDAVVLEHAQRAADRRRVRVRLVGRRFVGLLHSSP